MTRAILHDMTVLLARLAYSPDQPRDDHGRFGEGESGTLPAEQEHALEVYQDDYSGGINAALRSGDASNPIVGQLDKAIESEHATHEETVYRALAGMNPDELFQDGEIFHDAGFVSTTSSLDTARDYASDTEGTAIEIHLIEGQPRYDYGAHGDTTSHEVLLPRGSNFYAEKNADAPGGWRLYAFVPGEDFA